MTDVKPRGGHYSSLPVKQKIMTAVWVTGTVSLQGKMVFSPIADKKKLHGHWKTSFILNTSGTLQEINILEGSLH